jgi:16S rRNA (guanine527-N7)-methyltransferase
VSGDPARKSLTPWSDRLSRPVDVVAEDLGRFHALLGKWQTAQNLVSRETLDAFWTRHIADSLQVLPLLPQGEAKIFDLGSGGGFPGLPLAVALVGSGPHFVLCESNARKVAFLRTAIRQMTLDARVQGDRIEDIDLTETGQANIVLARALAPLNQLMKLSFPLLKSDGVLIFHKGRENQREIDAAGANWHFDVVRHASTTDDHGVLLEICNLRPRS